MVSNISNYLGETRLLAPHGELRQRLHSFLRHEAKEQRRASTHTCVPINTTGSRRTSSPVNTTSNLTTVANAIYFRMEVVNDFGPIFRVSNGVQRTHFLHAENKTLQTLKIENNNMSRLRGRVQHNRLRCNSHLWFQLPRHSLAGDIEPLHNFRINTNNKPQRVGLGGHLWIWDSHTHLQEKDLLLYFWTSQNP